MKPKSLTPMGSMHPVLFFVFIYAVTLLVSVFICSSLFYSCHSSAAEKVAKEKGIKNQPNGKTEVVAFSQ
ncbi:MAG TPA: hypothetical protein VN451_01970 [Chitinophagaceae bacterium]|nr:hypothetical protein [Chitinophagaceae bacterium]